jgi:hypothetical protein
MQVNLAGSIQNGQATMMLTDSFWRGLELDLQDLKISYLSWSIGYAREPPERYRHLFLWPKQTEFCVVNSRNGNTFANSPFGPGVRGVPRSLKRPIPRGLDEIDLALIARLNSSTSQIRESITSALQKKDYKQARKILLNFYWLKLGPHQLLFENIQFNRIDDFDRLEKGRWGLDESEKWSNLTGIQNRIINVIRYGEHLQTEYVKRLNKKLPGFSPGSRTTFLAAALNWNRYSLCAFDCGPVLWSRKGFVHFNQVKNRMNELGWPYQSHAREVLKPLYYIALDYRRSPIWSVLELDQGYSLKSMRRRACQLFDVLDAISDKIDRLRSRITKESKKVSKNPGNIT